MKFSGKLTPFDQGALSVKESTDTDNPFEAGSVEFSNFELGRSYALRLSREGAMAQPWQRLRAKAG